MRYFMYGTPSRALKADHLPGEEVGRNCCTQHDCLGIMEATGGNTGNLLIGHAITRELKEVAEELMIGAALPVDRINAEFDAVVISASNFLIEGTDFSSLAPQIERLKVPVITIALGAQMESGQTKLRLLPGSRRFFDVLAGKCATLGVRGAITAELLESMGIKNVEIMGCPTCFMSCDPEFGVGLPQLEGKEGEVLLNYERNAKCTSLLKLAMEAGAALIFQTEAEEYLLAAGASDLEHRVQSLERIYADFGATFDPATREYLVEHGRMFFSVYQWREYVSGFKFAFGGRMHGNMMAMQAGVPALWISHDSRTDELAQSLSLPTISIDQALGCRDVKELAERGDYDRFNRDYRRHFARYRRFLDRNGLHHGLGRRGRLDWVRGPQRPAHPAGLSVEEFDPSKGFSAASVGVFTLPISDDGMQGIGRRGQISEWVFAEGAIRIVASGDDPQFELSPLNLPQEPMASYELHLAISSSNRSLVQVFWQSAGQESFSEASSQRVRIMPQLNHLYVSIPGDFSGRLRIDPSSHAGTYFLHALELRAVPAPAMADPVAV